MIMKLLVVLFSLAYTVQADVPICGENNWNCMTQNLTKLNEKLQAALPDDNAYTFKMPEVQKGFGFQFIAEMNNIVAQVGGDKISAYWQKEDGTYTNGIVEVVDMNAEFSVDLLASIKILGPIDLFEGTISMNVDNFNAYVDMGFEDGKFFERSCNTDPEAITIKFLKAGKPTKTKTLISYMVKRLTPSIMKGQSRIAGISADLIGKFVDALTSKQQKSTLSIDLCKVIDVAFYLINSMSDGVGGWITQQANSANEDSP